MTEVEMTLQELIKRLKEVKRFDYFENEFGYLERDYSLDGGCVSAEDIEAIIKEFEGCLGDKNKEINADDGEGIMSSHWHKKDY